MNKVLKGLKQCLREPGTEMQCGDCPYYRQGERVEDCMDRLMMVIGQLEEFAKWVAVNVVADDWETAQDFYGEIICRKLVKLGYIVKDGEFYRLNTAVK